MTLDTARRALAFGARQNPSGCGIVFFGGEPLLCKPLIREVIADARELGRKNGSRFHFKVTTNGLLIDDDFLGFALREDLHIALSLDGVVAAHDLHRRTVTDAPTHATVLARLRLLLSVRPYTNVLLVVTPETAPLLVDSVRMLISEGVRYLVISMDYSSPGWTEDSFATLAQSYEGLAEAYIEWTRAGVKFYLSPFEVKLSSHINRHCFKRERCELGLRQLSVDTEGSLYPCVQFATAGPSSPWCIGNVDTGVDEVARERLRAASEAEKQACAGCVIRERCNHSCGCLNWQTTGDLNQVSPVLCRYEQMLIPLADRIGATLYAERNPHFIQKHYNPAYPVVSLFEDSLS